MRDLVHAADPEVTETIKRTKQPYFTLNGNICALLGAKEHLNDSRDKEDNFPARTGLHRSPVGYKWKEIHQRGDEFYDWDGHAFHFIGGIPKNADGSLALYTPKEQDEYLRELAESLNKTTKPDEWMTVTKPAR